MYRKCTILFMAIITLLLIARGINSHFSRSSLSGKTSVVYNEENKVHGSLVDKDPVNSPKDCAPAMAYFRAVMPLGQIWFIEFSTRKK